MSLCARTLVVAIMSVAACCLALPAAAQQSLARKPLVINVIDTTPSLSDLPLLTMQQIGGEYNMKITITDVRGGGQSGQVFVGGAGDVLLVGIDTPVGIVQRGLADIKIIGNMVAVTNWGLVVLADSPIRTLTDLRGKTVGITGPDALSELTLRRGVKVAGLDPDKDIQRIGLGSLPALSAALENRKIDASVLVPPELTQMVSSRAARLIGDWATVPYPGDVPVVRTRGPQQRRDDFVRFQNLMVEAFNRMKNLDYAFKIARMRYPHNCSDDELKQQLQYHLTTIWASLDARATEQQYQSATKMWVGSGRFKPGEVPSFVGLVDNLASAR
jgi:ABC-type nitrate/sulfonate/bicarbonate transport system substrate-binding protein